ncbi:MAG: 50S ribosomal protein L3 [bacterium]|nr:50S ribosomal protein L3 [Clostridia bacterium]MCR5553632.1 50S ribosomal protein L3 [bacterium]
MKNALLGKKIGMSQIFTANGQVVPVTVVEAGPCMVSQIKTADKDGYEAVQLAFCDTKENRLTKAEAGHLKKANVAPKKYLKEFKISAEGLTLGSEIKCDVFKAGDLVDVSGTSKGHGFSGVIKRWNAHRLPMTHGAGPVHREPGSMAANSDPSRVFKNKKLPGQYGNEKVTIQNLEIAKVDVTRNLLLIKGAIPGAKGSVVTISSAVKAN